MNSKWFEEKLLEKKASQADLARHLNIDRAAVCRLLSGNRRMNIDEIEPIANFFNVEPSVIFNVSKKQKTKPKGAFMDRHSMVERLISDDKKTIEQGILDGDMEYLEDILMYGIGYDKQTLREIIDEYNSRTWEDE